MQARTKDTIRRYTPRTDFGTVSGVLGTTLAVLLVVVPDWVIANRLSIGVVFLSAFLLSLIAKALHALLSRQPARCITRIHFGRGARLWTWPRSIEELLRLTKAQPHFVHVAAVPDETTEVLTRLRRHSFVDIVDKYGTGKSMLAYLAARRYENSHRVPAHELLVERAGGPDTAVDSILAELHRLPKNTIVIVDDAHLIPYRSRLRQALLTETESYKFIWIETLEEGTESVSDNPIAIDLQRMCSRLRHWRKRMALFLPLGRLPQWDDALANAERGRFAGVWEFFFIATHMEATWEQLSDNEMLALTAVSILVLISGDTRIASHHDTLQLLRAVGIDNQPAASALRSLQKERRLLRIVNGHMSVFHFNHAIAAVSACKNRPYLQSVLFRLADDILRSDQYRSYSRLASLTRALGQALPDFLRREVVHVRVGILLDSLNAETVTDCINILQHARETAPDLARSWVLAASPTHLAGRLCALPIHTLGELARFLAMLRVLREPSDRSYSEWLNALGEHIDSSLLARKVDVSDRGDLGKCAMLVAEVPDVVERIDARRLVRTVAGATLEEFGVVALFLRAVPAVANALSQLSDWDTIARRLVRLISCAEVQDYNRVASLLTALPELTRVVRQCDDWDDMAGRIAGQISRAELPYWDACAKLLNALRDNGAPDVVARVDFDIMANRLKGIRPGQWARVVHFMHALGQQSGLLSESLDPAATKQSTESLVQNAATSTKDLRALVRFLSFVPDETRNECIATTSWMPAIESWPITHGGISTLTLLLLNEITRAQILGLDVEPVRRYVDAHRGQIQEAIAEVLGASYVKIGTVSRLIRVYLELGYVDRSRALGANAVDRLTQRFWLSNGAIAAEFLRVLSLADDTAARRLVDDYKVRGWIVNKLNEDGVEGRALATHVSRVSPKTWRIMGQWLREDIDWETSFQAPQA